MAARPSTPSPTVLTAVWLGMPILDVTGRVIGTVKYVRPRAPFTAADEDPAHETIATAFARALTEHEPTIADTLTAQFVQNGFLKATGAGLMDNDLYITTSQIAAADEDAVRLSCTADELAVERETWD